MGSGAGKESKKQTQESARQETLVDVQDSLNHPEHPYKYCTIVSNEANAIPYELVESEDHYFIILELPGVSGIKQVRVACLVTDTGYDVTVSGTKPSAIEATGADGKQKEAVVEGQKCTRRLGEVSWHGVICGVFEAQPECNYREGIFKMRMKKRAARNERVHFTDF